jgi:hypothetical protein
MVWSGLNMFTIWQKSHLFNRPQLVSTYTTNRTSRVFSCTGYKTASSTKTDRNHPSDKEAARKAYMQAYSRRYYAEKADAIKEASRNYYKANKEFVLHRQKQHDLRTGGALKARSSSNERNEINQLAIKDEVERKIHAGSKRRHAGEKVESERRHAEMKAEREQRRAEQRVEHQKGLAQKKAMHDEQRARRRAARTEADRELLRQKAVEYRRDPVVRKKQVDIEQQRRAIDNNYARRADMRIWLLRCSQPQAFSWKTHVPIIYPRKVVKTCSACGKIRHAGARLWWKRLGLYECHTCYTADVSRAMPRGFENFVFGNGRNPRP